MKPLLLYDKEFKSVFSGIAEKMNEIIQKSS